MKFRPPAAPLVTVDPFFSIWSCADTLYGDCTRNWTQIPNPIMTGVYVNNVFYSFGTTAEDFSPVRRTIHQTGLTVTPLCTKYTFEDTNIKATLTFTTPLLLDRLDIMTRPVSYVQYEIEKNCDKPMDIDFVFGIGARCCTRNNKQIVAFKKTGYSLCCGNIVQTPLSQSGDVDMIDWGYLHLCDKDAFVSTINHYGEMVSHPINQTYNAYVDMPYMTVKKSELSGVITIAYDEIKPIEYFGEALDEYYTKYFDSFDDMAKTAIKEYIEVKKLCDEFDKELMSEASKLNENYMNITSLAYRQAIAAHKLVCDKNGDLLFLSKECESNGCIGTLDVTYPSIPLFLKYNSELVAGMLRPIIKYAKSDAWEYEFAPHDVGRYPLANGQAYGMQHKDPQKRLHDQMPVEESGNMLLCLGAIAKYSGKTPELFAENMELMKQWADYLVEYGYDPGNQLCTDDFAGHLAHNCNLSLKAILGIACYSMLSGDKSYMDIARKYATQWENDAKSKNGATRLTFDLEDGWSLKYNIVWDKMLGFNIFSDKIKKAEVELYKTKINRYGVPLDSRSDYTKIDWLMWSTCIFDDKDYFNMVCESMVNMINETYDRVPLTDWYYSSTAKHVFFQNRSVVGGLFINLL